MEIVLAFWLASLAGAWLLTIGAIRLLAHRSGTDSTTGMGRVAALALSLGAVTTLVAVVLGVLVVRG